MVVTVLLEDERRETPSLDTGRAPDAAVEDERREDELMVRGVAGGLSDAAVLNGRPMTGTEGLEEVNTGDFGVAGLFHEEKKSSSPPPCSTAVAAASAAPSTATRSGNLKDYV